MTPEQGLSLSVSKPLRPLVVIIGPTGVGKTELSIELAERLEGEIVSADSRLFYRGMDIGTAKPSPVDQLRVPHHLIDVANPDEIWSLAMFQEAARAAIRDIHQRGHLPFLVGGTGQYIRAVIEEWEIPKIKPNPLLRRTLERWAEEIGPGGMHARLSVLDSRAAASIDPRNLRRTIRALEVILSSGRRFSDQRVKGVPAYDLLQIGLIRPRAQLYHKVDERIQMMLGAGFVKEVQQLLEKGYSTDLPTMSAIGYHEIAAYLKGQISLEEATLLIKRRTRAFVRRQANWFKLQDPNIFWFNLEEHVESNKVLEEIESLIRRWRWGK